MSLNFCMSVGRRTASGFTLSEVVISIMLSGILFGGLISGYIFSARRVEWSAHSLAAQSLAVQGIEQARAAQWDAGVWPVVDQLPPTNFTRVEILDLPASGGQTAYATNFISVTTVSTNPPLREIRVDCVWLFAGRDARLYTNSVVTYRASDQ